MEVDTIEKFCCGAVGSVSLQGRPFPIDAVAFAIYLDRESTEAIIHAFVTTNLDYCNAILYGLPKVLLIKPLTASAE